MPMTETTESPTISLTDAAITKVAQLLGAEEPGLALRVAVEAGGCSGLRYQLFFDNLLDGDTEYHFDTVRVLVDPISLPHLTGAVVDFTDTISQQGFTIENPNACGTCACGDSFN